MFKKKRSAVAGTSVDLEAERKKSQQEEKEAREKAEFESRMKMRNVHRSEVGAITVLRGREQAKVESIQNASFTKWVNMKVGEPHVNDLVSGFKNGQNLLRLLSALSGQTVSFAPRMLSASARETVHHQLAVYEKAFQFMADEGIRPVGIGPQDIMNGNMKLILGLVWILILHYHMTEVCFGKTKHPPIKGARGRSASSPLSSGRSPLSQSAPSSSSTSITQPKGWRENATTTSTATNTSTTTTNQAPVQGRVPGEPEKQLHEESGVKPSTTSSSSPSSSTKAGGKTADSPTTRAARKKAAKEESKKHKKKGKKDSKKGGKEAMKESVEGKERERKKKEKRGLLVDDDPVHPTSSSSSSVPVRTTSPVSSEQANGSDAQSSLLEWVKEKVETIDTSNQKADKTSSSSSGTTDTSAALPPVRVEAKDFASCMQDGRVLCCLVESMVPGSIDIHTLEDNSAVDNLTLAVTIAKEKLGIPELIEPDAPVEELSAMLYVSCFKEKENQVLKSGGGHATETDTKPGQDDTLVEAPPKATPLSTAVSSSPPRSGGSSPTTTSPKSPLRQRNNPISAPTDTSVPVITNNTDQSEGRTDIKTDKVHNEADDGDGNEDDDSTGSDRKDEENSAIGVGEKDDEDEDEDEEDEAQLVAKINRLMELRQRALVTPTGVNPNLQDASRVKSASLPQFPTIVSSPGNKRVGSSGMRPKHSRLFMRNAPDDDLSYLAAGATTTTPGSSISLASIPAFKGGAKE